jgi:hypothetical protein
MEVPKIHREREAMLRMSGEIRDDQGIKMGSRFVRLELFNDKGKEKMGLPIEVEMPRVRVLQNVESES